MKDFTTAVTEVVAFLECQKPIAIVDLVDDLVAMASVLPGAKTPFAPPWCETAKAKGEGLRRLEHAPRQTATVAEHAKNFLISVDGKTRPAWTADGGAPPWVGQLIQILLQILITWLGHGTVAIDEPKRVPKYELPPTPPPVYEVPPNASPVVSPPPKAEEPKPVAKVEEPPPAKWRGKGGR